MGTNVRWLIGSSWTAQIGDGVALAAGPLLIASQTHDPFLVAMGVLVQRLPWLLFGLYAGAVADRLDRRRLVITVDLLRVLALAVLVAAIGGDVLSIGVVLVALFCFGTSEVFADTTSSTLLPMVVDKQDLGVANARLMAGFVTVNQMLGPPLGAALFTAGDRKSTRLNPFTNAHLVCRLLLEKINHPCLPSKAYCILHTTLTLLCH